MTWRIQRDPDGTPRRLLWIPPEVEERIRKEKKMSRTLRYVEPHPWAEGWKPKEVKRG